MEYPASKAREHFPELIDRVDDRQDPVVLTRHTKKIVVLMPILDLETIEALEDEEDERDVREFHEQRDRGEITLIPLDEAMKQLGWNE